VPNEADNLLTVTGADDRIVDLLAAITGAEELIDFTLSLPEAPVDEDGAEPSWWLVNAIDSSVETRETGKVALYFQTAWEPPIDWANALAVKYPDLNMTLLYAEEGQGFAGLWVSNEHGTDENTLAVTTVGYPAVWSFLTSLGYDFGWEHPDSEPYDPGTIPVIG